MNRKEKQEAKAERYRALARSSRQKADDACRQSNAAVENIPFGQPILVGHHSEKAHRRAIEQSKKKMDKCLEYNNRAEYYENKAKSAESNTSIYLGDDDSVDRLQAKLDGLVKMQETMKATNKIVRSKLLSEEDKEVKLSQMGYSQNSIKELMTPYITKAISKNGRYVAQITSLIEDIPQVYSLPEKITQEDADAIMEGVYDALKDIGRISIGEQIQEHRKEQGLSQKDLADMVGFTHTNISRIEQGKYNVSLDILNRISYALGREIKLE